MRISKKFHKYAHDIEKFQLSENPDFFIWNVLFVNRSMVMIYISLKKMVNNRSITVNMS